MNKAIAKKLRKIILFYIIPFILLGVWFGFSFWALLTYNASFSVLPYSHKEESVITPRKITLYRGISISGRITAKEDNLGAIAIRLHNFHPGGIPEDTLVFSIKEKNAKEWYYQHEYSGGQFHELYLFPFGFPKIPDSKGKTYVFQLRSVSGYSLTAVDLIDQNPIVVSEYQFSKKEIFFNKKALVAFIVKKIFYQVQNLDVKLLLLIFPAPLLLYMFSLSSRGSFLYRPFSKAYTNLSTKIDKKKNSRIVKILIFLSKHISIYDLLIFTIVLIDILFINTASEMVILVLLVLLFMKIIIFKSQSNNEISASFIFLLVTVILSSMNNQFATERAGIWTFVFLTIGITRSLINF